MPDNPPIIAGVRIGHVHLKVADLDRALAFYCGVLGFEVTQRLSSGAAFIAAGDYHHHIGLNTWGSAGGEPPPPGSTGLYHVAFVYPGRRELASAIRRLVDHGYEIDHGTDHAATVSVYLEDPDGNGVELYYDRPREAWFDDKGRPILQAERIPIESI
jgi:catechol 2,3-dioxygenase